HCYLLLYPARVISPDVGVALLSPDLSNSHRCLRRSLENPEWGGAPSLGCAVAAVAFSSRHPLADQPSPTTSGPPHPPAHWVLRLGVPLTNVGSHKSDRISPVDGERFQRGGLVGVGGQGVAAGGVDVAVAHQRPRGGSAEIVQRCLDGRANLGVQWHGAVLAPEPAPAAHPHAALARPQAHGGPEAGRPRSSSGASTEERTSACSGTVRSLPPNRPLPRTRTLPLRADRRTSATSRATISATRSPAEQARWQITRSRSEASRATVRRKRSLVRVSRARGALERGRCSRTTSGEAPL